MDRRKRIVTSIVLLTLLSMASCGKESAPEIDPVSDKVMADISSIGAVELDDKDLIEKIERTYATLTDKQKEQVDNYAALLTARDQLDELIKADEAEKAKAEEQQRKEEAKKEREEKSKEIHKGKVNVGETFCARCIVALKNTLKNPESLQVIQYGAGKDNGEYYMLIEYSAQNGFGGYDRSYAYITDVPANDGMMIIEPITQMGIITESTFEQFGMECPITSEQIAEGVKNDGIDRDVVDKVIAKYEETNDITWLDYVKI